MMISKSDIRYLLCAGSQRLGFLDLCRIFKMRHKCFILTYHRVIQFPEEETIFVQPGMYVTIETFRRHILFLKKHFHILAMAELIDRINNNDNIGGCCAVTFDDGWRDNFTRAYPVLREYQVPATIFLATGFIDSDRLFWPEELSFYLRQPEVKEYVTENQVFKQYGLHFYDTDPEEDLLEKIIESMKLLLPYKRTEILDLLKSVSPSCHTKPLMMDWEKVREMAGSGLISFGSHTVNHVILDQIPKSEAEEEIKCSLLDIANNLGVEPVLFAYPNGNFNCDLKAILKRFGIKGAFTTKKGFMDHKMNPLTIPRIAMHNDVSHTDSLFFARILFKRF